LLITIFLGANDAVSSPQVHVPLDTFITNIRSFVKAILTSPATSSTKILLITPPPINAQKAFPEDYDVVDLAGETFAESEKKFEMELRNRSGFKTWCSKLRYAEAIVTLAGEFKDREDGRVAVADFWRSITNHGLSQEGRRKLVEGNVDTKVNGKWPGCGLPGAEEFDPAVFTDRLHLGAKGYEVLSAEVLDVLDKNWPNL
jgi:isoamyl acetate esterase